MRVDTSTIGIAPGEGLVARFGEVVIYLVGANASTERILGAVEAVANAEHPGAAIAQRLAAVVFGTGSEPPPFGLVAPAADGTLVLLRGPVSASISGAEGTRTLVGARAFTWVDEILRDPVRTLAVGPGSDARVTPYPRTDLRAGVVPGGGFVIHAAVRRTKRAKNPAAVVAAGTPNEPAATAPAGLAAAEPEPESDSGPPTGFAGSPAADPLPGTRAWSAAPGPRVKAEPVRIRPEAERSRAGTAAKAIGSGGPQAKPARVDPQTKAARVEPQTKGARAEPEAKPGRAGAEQKPVRLGKEPGHPYASRGHDEGRHPAAPVLVAEDGTAYPLDRAYVIGRGPSVDESVRRNTAAPLVLQRDRHISRVHAYLAVDGGKVFLRDAGTAAGTFVSTPGEPRWTRISQSPTELPPGGRIRISEQVLTYQDSGNGSS
ncbi:FHA domain-containing protein [Nocardia sp. NPDC024068]|uniref:FHA domain-containing protein n=1 Tax=Nocardia sp. NPDC024068 TaxID=3157197 RepID=UPI0033D9B235